MTKTIVEFESWCTKYPGDGRSCNGSDPWAQSKYYLIQITVKLRAVNCLHIIYEGEIWCLCIVTLVQKSSKLNRRLVYCLRLYGMHNQNCTRSESCRNYTLHDPNPAWSKSCTIPNLHYPNPALRFVCSFPVHIDDIFNPSPSQIKQTSIINYLEFHNMIYHVGNREEYCN